MKKQSLVIGTALAATLISSTAMAVSANMGVVSSYYFRGVAQTGTSGNGGVDFELGEGISAGVWFADVGNGPAGIEYDIYGAYSGKTSDIDYSVGFTSYQYTGTFDTSYNEVNLGAGFGPVAVDVAIGTHEQVGASDNSYTFLSVSGDLGPVAATFGTWSGDYSGSYLEFGISTDIGGADAGLSLITSSSDATDLTTDGTSVVFSLSKGFEL